MEFTETFEKQVDEQIPFGLDYAERLPTGKTISSAAMTAFVYPDGTDASGDVLSGVATVTATRIVMMLIGGVDGKDYKITFKANLTGGGVLEDDVLMQVRNK